MMLRICVLLMVAFPAYADLEPGNWEITVRTEVQGMPDPQGFTQAHCLTAATARDPARLFGSRGLACEFTDRNDNGSVFTFVVVCGTQPPAGGKGSVSYSRDSLTGDFELSLEGLVTRSRIAGRRLGGC